MTQISPDPAAGPVVLAFGEHELHPNSGELFRAGVPVKLQTQPARVLEALVRRAGEVVSREDIQAHVWGEGTFLDADANLNFCIRQIRRALDDPASAPRYIETIPRRGYRFLVPVETRRPAPRSPAPVPELAPPEPAVPPRPGPLHRLGLAAAAAGLALLALFAAARRFEPPQSAVLAAPAEPIPEEAREHYRTALYLSPADPERAISELRQAILKAPRYAEAHAQLALEESERPVPPQDLLPGLEMTAQRAVDLDPHLGLAHLALGRVLWRRKLDWLRGEAELRQAVALDPDRAEAWHELASLLAGRGEHEQAIAAARQARALDPAGMLVNADLAWFYYLGRRYDEAIRQAASTVTLKDSRKIGLSRKEARFFRWAWRVILYSSLQTGDRRAGLEAARALMTEYGDPAAARMLDRLEEYWGWERERFLELARPLGGPIAIADGLAANAAAAGQIDLALPYLEDACRQRWPNLLIAAAADPLLAPLQGNPRFEKFLDCIGVPRDAPARRRRL